MKIEDWYRDNFEFHLSGRYITLKTVFPLLDMYKRIHQISIPGTSELGKDIPLIKVGQGSKIVLAWSQMHGNESTTTKAIFDFLKFLNQKKHFQTEINSFLNEYSVYILPILNPDGAEKYTRENANGVDLNRDAQALSQMESKCLRSVFDALKPDLCLNLHDQRSIYGLDSGLPATLSFLAPAADSDRSVTEARKTAMKYIVNINKVLQIYIPGQVGRYDDSFNEACVGDTFQKTGTATILFEAGHYKHDYQREKSREFIFYSLLALFGILEPDDSAVNYKDYFDIPENLKNYKDFILWNAKLEGYDGNVSIAVQFSEELKNGKVEFVPTIDEIGTLDGTYGHRENSASGTEVLSDSQEKLKVGKNISKIVNKFDNSTIYFQ